MSETKWTPGPWHTGGIFDPGTPNATMNIWGPTAPGMQSGEIIVHHAKIHDATLIAAAPELYAALLAMRKWGRSRWLEVAPMADAALAKARGEKL